MKDLDLVKVLNGKYCIVDIEVSGLSKKEDEIIEIGVMKIENGKQQDRLITLVNPRIKLKEAIVDITNITNDMLDKSPNIEEVLKEVIEFVKDDIIVLYNGRFDSEFLKEAYEKCNFKFENNFISLIDEIKFMYPGLKDYKLDTVANFLGVIKSDNFKDIMLERLLMIKHVCNILK